jgi:RHS repeat-associated protein
MGVDLDHSLYALDSNVYLYRREQYDSDLQLYYLRARYFNPLTGRFITRGSGPSQAAPLRRQPVSLRLRRPDQPAKNEIPKRASITSGPGTSRRRRGGSPARTGRRLL